MTGLLPSGAAMSSQALTTRAARPRSVIIAALLSAIAPGVGQLYAGRPWRGVALFVAMLAIAAAIIGVAFLIPASFAAFLAFAVGAVTVMLAAYLYVIVDAVWLARRGSRMAYRWYVQVAAVAAVYLVLEVILVGLAIVLPSPPWGRFDVASASMEPTLRPGEMILVDASYFGANPPSRGDVVVYRLPKDPETIEVRRIVALGGDRVSFRNGRVFINGVAAREPYARLGDPNAPINTIADIAVPANTVFVAGDSRDSSIDSRDSLGHGPVPLENLVGRATEILVTSLPDRAGLWVGAPR
jgi:signal peptidase I